MKRFRQELFHINTFMLLSTEPRPEMRGEILKQRTAEYRRKFK